MRDPSRDGLTIGQRRARRGQASATGVPVDEARGVGTIDKTPPAKAQIVARGASFPRDRITGDRHRLLVFAPRRLPGVAPLPFGAEILAPAPGDDPSVKAAQRLAATERNGGPIDHARPRSASDCASTTATKAAKAAGKAIRQILAIGHIMAAMIAA